MIDIYLISKANVTCQDTFYFLIGKCSHFYIHSDAFILLFSNMAFPISTPQKSPSITPAQKGDR